MKKNLIICLSLLLVGGICFAAKTEEGPFVNSSSTITKELSPNYAIISISVETLKKDVKEATDENATVSNNVVETLKTLLNTKKGETIETTDYNVAPQYSHKDGKSVLTNYKVSNTIKIKLRDMQSVSAIIDEAIKAGATRISNLKFGLDEEANICNELYAKATKNAYSQAQSVAKALGSEVVGARSIDTSCIIDNPDMRYSNYYSSDMVMGAKASAGSSTPVEAGAIKVRATINGSFNIK